MCFWITLDFLLSLTKSFLIQNLDIDTRATMLVYRVDLVHRTVVCQDQNSYNLIVVPIHFSQPVSVFMHVRKR